MTEHYFDHPLVNLHYYRFGSGKKMMLCFHGYGMHGKQFKILESILGDTYTFYGFDLFFHKETKLTNQSLDEVKRGLDKMHLIGLITDFCFQLSIDKFSVMGYSMGTHFATTLAEHMPGRLTEYVVIAPSCLKPGAMLEFLSRNRIGNKLLEKMALSNTGMLRMLKACRKLGIIDDKGHDILFKEIATPELRFSFYACATYFRLLKTDQNQLIRSLNEQAVKSIFIFGKRDANFPARIGNKVIPHIKHAQTIILDSNHEMINRDFAHRLSEALA